MTMTVGAILRMDARERASHMVDAALEARKMAWAAFRRSEEALQLAEAQLAWVNGLREVAD